MKELVECEEEYQRDCLSIENVANSVAFEQFEGGWVGVGVDGYIDTYLTHTHPHPHPHPPTHTHTHPHPPTHPHPHPQIFNPSK